MIEGRNAGDAPLEIGAGPRLGARARGNLAHAEPASPAEEKGLAHAVANGVFVAAVNRVGHEGPADGGLEFWGASFVSDPFGRVLKRGDHGREELLIVECDRERIEETRRNWPFLRDRRIDAYGDLTQRLVDGK